MDKHDPAIERSVGKLRTICRRLDAGESITVEEVAWLAIYSLRVVARAYELLRHMDRLSSRNFEPRVKLERALRNEREGG